MKILLAVDGSPYSTAAVDEVAARPWPANSSVRVLSVVQHVPPPALEFTGSSAHVWDQLSQERNKVAEETVASAASSLKSTPLHTETAVRDGEPRSGIVDEAVEWGADLIVLGSHGHTGLKRWLLGSVAQSVVSHAPCSVEVVRKR